MSDALLNLVGEIYEAACRPEHWPTVVKQVGELLRAKSGGLFFEDCQTGTRCLLGHYGLPRASPLAYRFGLAKYDYVFKLQQRQQPGAPRQLVDHREVKDDHPLYYRFLLKPHDIGYVCAMVVIDDGEWHVGLGFHRSFNSTPFKAHDLDLLQRLYPHFKRSLRIQREFHRLRNRAQSLHRTLSRVTLGVVVLGPDFKAAYANPVAEKILAQHPGLVIQNGRLQAHYPEDNARLARMISELAKADPADVRYRDLALSLHHPEHQFPLTVMLATLNEPVENPVPLHGNGSIVLYLSVADAAVTIPAEVLEDVYAMTPAEANVAIGLANGLDLKQISAQNSVSLETVRTQLKSVFSKMGVSKQQDVIRLLLSGAVRLEPIARQGTIVEEHAVRAEE